MQRPAPSPDAVALLDAAVRLMDVESPDTLRAEHVLAAAGLDAAALANCYPSFEDLLEEAMVVRFARYVDESIATIAMVLSSSKDAEELREWLVRITVSTQAPDRASRRLERAAGFGRALHNERFRSRLGAEQQRLTNALVDLVAGGQGRGWISAEVDAYAMAVLVQAYTLGRVVDDVVEQKISPEAWNELIISVVDRVMFRG